MADQMAAKGHDVTYLTRSHPGGYPGVPFVVEEVSAAPIHNARGDRTMGGALRFSWGVLRQLRRHRGDYDLLVVSALPVLTLLAARVANFGSAATLVADWLEVWPWRKWRDYSGAVVGTIAAVLQWIGARATPLNSVNSRFTADRLAAVNRRAHPMVLGLFDLAPTDVTVRAAAVPPVALFVGRWIADKRVDTIPAAIARARDRVPGLECEVVGSGSGSEEARVRAAIASADADSYVRTPGRVSDEVLHELMSAAAVLVNPSSREGFGLVLIESAERGVPVVVVAGEDNASAELVIPGINGFIATDASPAALGTAIADAVLGGRALRTSTAAWFASARVEGGFGRSVDALLALAENRARRR
jgi:glycosyltransferase involved in cell wall biosynthesis